MIASTRRHVVVKGMGVVTGLGPTLKAAWERLLLTSAIQAAAAVPEDWVDPYTPRTTSRTAALALTAARQALRQAGYEPGKQCFDKEKIVGVAMGTGMMSLHDLPTEGTNKKRLSPYVIPKMLPNTAAACISIELGCTGPVYTESSACAAAAHAIGLAYQQLVTGAADVMIAGGVETPLHPVAYAGFGRTLSSSGMGRPFDQDRDGFCLAEGAAVLVLEAVDEVPDGAVLLTGYGAACDAHHITAPAAAGQERAIRRALAGRTVDYVNAHATGTVVGDTTELEVLENMLQPGTAVSSTKGATGHTLGAAGAVEAVLTVQMLQHGLVLPTYNLESPVPSSLDLVQGSPRHMSLQRAASNSFGFGGSNACLVFEKV